MTLKQRILKDLEKGAVLSEMVMFSRYNTTSGGRRLRELREVDSRIKDRWVTKNEVRYKEFYLPRGKK